MSVFLDVADDCSFAFSALSCAFRARSAASSLASGLGSVACGAALLRRQPSQRAALTQRDAIVTRCDEYSPSRRSRAPI